MTAVALEAALRSSVLIVLIWVALALVRPRNPHHLKALWTCVVIASLGMPLLMQIHIAPAVAAPILHWTIRPGGGALAQRASTSVIALLVYGVPALLLLWRHAFAWTHLARIRRESQPFSAPWTEGLDVRMSERIASPSTFGTTVLLPKECSTWSTTKLAAVIAHERAHVVHRDCYVLWLARLHASIFWFNPLAWWLVRKLAVLAEHTSDDAAVETLGDRVDYAEILLALRMGRSSDLATAMASSDLPARIERILSGVALSPTLGRPQLVLVIAAVLPAVALAAAPLQRAAANSLAPHVLSWPTLPVLEQYYPPEAMHKGIEGRVDLAVTLDAAGRATDTQILTEYPLNAGFGAAASSLAHVMQYDNPTGQPVTFAVRVEFALKH